MQGLEACPFCKELYPEGEHGECPSCGVKLLPAAKVSETVDANDSDEDDEEETLPWLHWGHARGPLVVAALLGLIFFFLPWVSQFTPDRVTLSGKDIAQRTGLGWAVAASWFTLIPTVLSRRTVPHLRSGRMAAAMLALIPGVVVALLLLNPPAAIEARGVVLKVRFEWGIGVYLSLALSLLATPFAVLRLGKE